jgi:hypothetical protein
MKRYGNNKSTLIFLQIVYRSLGIPSPYTKFIKGIIWEWFTKDGVLKKDYIQVVEHGIVVKNPKQNMHELEKHPKLTNEMVHILQKMK